MGTVKTAISIDSELFDKINTLADEIKLSRSQIFTQAVKYFIDRKNNLELIRRINQAYSDTIDTIDEDETERLELSKQKYAEIIKEEWQ